MEVDREQIQRLKDQLAVETRPAADQFVQFFVPAPQALNGRSKGQCEVKWVSGRSMSGRLVNRRSMGAEMVRERWWLHLVVSL